MRFGIQMFGLNPFFLKEKELVLQALKKSGFRYIEPVIDFIGVPELREHVWTIDEYKENKVLLEKYGMTVNSCHVFSADIEKDLDALISFVKEQEIKQVVLGIPSLGEKEAYASLIEAYKNAGNALKAEGIELLLHNGENESFTVIDGMSLYEWVLRETKDVIGAQPDVGWILAAGIDPVDFLKRNRNQIKSLHYKDMEETESGRKETGVGRGILDMTECFQFAREIEVIQILDQDSSDDFLADIAFVGQKFASLAPCRDNTRSILNIMDADTGEIKKLRVFDKIIEAPNWMQTDEDSLIYNSDGRIYRYSISKDEETLIDSGKCTNCNNDHVLSPDNTQIAVSHSDTGWESKIYIFPIEGGTPREITPLAPSFLHGWSPDGKELAYCAFRGDFENGMEVDIRAISVEGGNEWQLTKNAGFNDGPEYAPNNKDIWFISTRSGLMQIYKMDRDGANQTQMTFTERNNWFPHVSPDGKRIVYLSYSKDGLDAAEHLPNMNVQLRMMNYDGSDDKVILEFFGGQGSINVNSWAPDNRRFAFVSYERI